MNYSYGTNADQYLNKEGLEYLISQLDLKYSGGSGSIGNDGVGIQSVELVNYELIVTLTDTTVINLGNIRGEKGLQGIQGLTGAKGIDGINGTNGKDGKDGTDGADGVNGRGITSVVKTNTVGLIDTYTITYSDMTTSNFTVTNGKDGADGEGGSGGGGSLPSYLTTETIVGTWLDGKTIYRKCFTFGSLGKEEYTFNHMIANVGDIVDIRQRLVVGANTYVGGNWIISYRPASYNKNDVSIVHATSTSIVVSMGGNVMNGNLIVYMDYTKTV